MVSINLVVGLLLGIVLTTVTKIDSSEVYWIWSFIFKGLTLLVALVLTSLYFFPKVYVNLLGAHLLSILTYLTTHVPVVANRERSVVKLPGINCGFAFSNGNKFLLSQYRAVLTPQMTGKRILLLKTIPEQYQTIQVDTVCPEEVLSNAYDPMTSPVPENINYIIVTPLEGYSIPFKPSNISMTTVWILNSENKIIKIVGSDQVIWA